MSVYQLGRVTFGLGRNGFDTHFIKLFVGRGGKHGSKAKLLKENSPEGVIFIHIQDTGNAHLSTLSFFYT